MIRGWYSYQKNEQHLLAIEAIAEACCISVREVRGWFGDRTQTLEPAGAAFVDAAEVIRFLTANNIPVAASLLPPKTRKILFLCEDEYQIDDKWRKFDQICRFLSGSSNILVETSTAGRAASLSILTFCPDLTIISLKTCNQELLSTFRLAINFPEQKTVFLVDEAVKSEVERALGDDEMRHLVLSDSVPCQLLCSQLHQILSN